MSGAILWILPILLAIPIGIAANIITPSAQNWLATRSHSRASKRISVLDSELSEVSYFHSNPNKLYLKSARVVFNILFFFLVGSILSTLSSVVTIVIGNFMDGYFNNYILVFFLGASIIPYIMAATSALNHIRLITRVDEFEEYKKTLQVQIEHMIVQQPKPSKKEQ